MTLALPFFFYSILPLSLAFWALYAYGQKRKAKRKALFSQLYVQGSSLVNHHSRLYFFKITLLYLGLVSLLLALARPQKGKYRIELQGKSVDIVFALDTSKSMLAQDIRPNRLSRAKLAIQDLLESLQGDRIGVIAFAGRAFLECPLTLDYQAFLQSLSMCDTTIIQEGGTDFAAAIDQALKSFDKDASYKTLILISDGEDLEKAGYTRALAAKEEGLIVYTVGVGSYAGDIIPIQDKAGKLDYVKDAQGQVVKSRLEEETLKAMAQITGGFYTPLGPKGEGLAEVYRHISQSVPAEERTSFYKEVPKEYFQWPLGFAFVLLFIETLIPTYAKAQFRFRKSYALRSVLSKKNCCFIGFLGLWLIFNSLLAAEDRGIQLYEEEAYAKARAFYEKRLEHTPKEPYLEYNLGCVAYQEGDYSRAQEAFEAGLHSTDPILQARAFYNLGNTHFQQASTPDISTPAVIESLEKAIRAYTNSLSLEKENPKAKANLALAQKELERIQEQEKAKQDRAASSKRDDEEPKAPKQDTDPKASNPGAPQPQDPEEENTSNSQESTHNRQAAPHNPDSSSPLHTEEGTANESVEPKAQEAVSLPSPANDAIIEEPSAEKQRLEAILEASKKKEKKLHFQHLGSGGAAPRNKQTLKDW